MLSIVKVLAVFCLIIIMLRKKVGLAITMIISAGVLGLIFGLGPLPLVRQMFLTLADLSTLELMAALVLIMMLEAVMRQTGMLRAMTDSLFRLPINPRVLIASVPAIIGILPSAGGARFSAPLVEQATSGFSYQAEAKVFINYWFRHMWELSLPIYPGLIMAAHFSGIPLSSIVVRQLPLSIIWAAMGYWYLNRLFRGERIAPLGDPPGGGNGSESVPGDLLQVLRMFALSTWPLWLALVLVLSSVPITPAIGIILIILVIHKRCPLGLVWKTLIDPLTFRIVFLVWGIMAFKDILKFSGAVDQISQAITSLGVPPIVLLTLLPLMVAMLTGLLQACVAVSFPLVMAMVEPSASYVMLAYISGMVGLMLSPVHLCLVLSVEYFKADFVRSYNPVLLPSAIMLAVTIFFSRLAL